MSSRRCQMKSTWVWASHAAGCRGVTCIFIQQEKMANGRDGNPRASIRLSLLMISCFLKSQSTINHSRPSLLESSPNSQNIQVLDWYGPYTSISLSSTWLGVMCNLPSIINDKKSQCPSANPGAAIDWLTALGHGKSFAQSTQCRPHSHAPWCRIRKPWEFCS